MGRYKWGYKSPNMGYEYSYPTYIPTYNYQVLGAQCLYRRLYLPASSLHGGLGAITKHREALSADARCPEGNRCDCEAAPRRRVNE